MIVVCQTYVLKDRLKTSDIFFPSSERVHSVIFTNCYRGLLLHLGMVSVYPPGREEKQARQIIDKDSQGPSSTHSTLLPAQNKDVLPAVKAAIL